MNDLYREYLANQDDFNESSQSHESIDPDDLLIIDEPLTWDPPEEIVKAYAERIGFDIINDPPELLEIAKKYLLMPLPGNLIRAFKKEDLSILYIDAETKNISLVHEYDINCKEEYEAKKKELEEKENKKKKKGKKERKNSSKGKSKSKSKKKGKKKKSSQNSSQQISNEEDEKDKSNIIDDKTKKKNLLIKSKESYKSYKKKLKANYIKSKKDTEKEISDEYERKEIIKKRGLKDELEKKKVKSLEQELEKTLKQNIEIYRNDLEPNYENEFLQSSNENNEELNNLELKKQQIMNEIQKQKEKNMKKSEEKRQKIQKEIELKLKAKKEMIQKEMDSLDDITNKKIDKFQKEEDRKYERYTHQIKLNYMNNKFKTDNNLNSEKRSRELLKECQNLIDEEFKERKKNLKIELEYKMEKELNEYKLMNINNNNNKSIEFKNNIINIEKNYYQELETFKSQHINNKNKFEEQINKINNNLKSTYKVDNMNRGQNELIKEMANNIDNIDEHIVEKNNEIFLNLLKNKSFYDFSEKEYIKKCVYLEYYKELTLLIINNILENNSLGNVIMDDNFKDKKSNDISLVNNLITKCKNLINKKTDEFKSKKIDKLFPNLENNFMKINKKQKGNNNISIIEKSFYEQSSKNAINTTVLLGDFNNNLNKTILKNNNNKSNLNNTLNNTMNKNNFNQRMNNTKDNLINNTSLSENKNISLFRNSNNNFINNKVNNIIPKNLNLSHYTFNNYNDGPTTINNNINLKSNNNIPNNSNINSNIYRNINEENNILNSNTRYLNQNNITYNRNVSSYMNDYSNYYNNKNDKDNKNETENMNYKLDDIPSLNEASRLNLSNENLNLYNEIIGFFKKEFESLNEKINKLKNKNFCSQQLNLVKDSIEFKKYQNIFNDIYKKENKKKEEISKEISLQKNNLNKIINECNTIFDNINSEKINLDNINDQFKGILRNIDKYYNNQDNNNVRKSSSVDNKYMMKNRISDIKVNNDETSPIKIRNNYIGEEDKSNSQRHNDFVGFYNAYNPAYFSSRINNSFAHSFFNYKKNSRDVNFRIMSSKLF